jgi:hypothetical protein
LLLTARMPSLSRKRRIRFSLDSSRSKGSDPLSQNEPNGVATVAARPTISRLTSADRLLASDRCGKIVTLLESSMRGLEGLRKRYYRDALREFFFRQSLLGARAASTGSKRSSPMTTWATMRTACGAICLAGSLSMGEPAKASPARLPWGLLQISATVKIRACL